MTFSADWYTPCKYPRHFDDKYKAVALNMSWDFDRMLLVSISAYNKVEFARVPPDGHVGIADEFGELIDPTGNEIPQAPNFTANALLRYDFQMGSSTMGAVQVELAYTDDYWLNIVNSEFYREKSRFILNARAEIYSAADGAWNIAIWGRNLTDEVFRTSI